MVSSPRHGRPSAASRDRPLVILLAHILAVTLYATHKAATAVPLSDNPPRLLATSPIMPALHVLGAAALLLGIKVFRSNRSRGVVATTSVLIWAFTTATLYLDATAHTPALALWAPALSFVITVAAVLMLMRWGVGGDESEDA